MRFITENDLSAVTVLTGTVRYRCKSRLYWWNIIFPIGYSFIISIIVEIFVIFTIPIYYSYLKLFFSLVKSKSNSFLTGITSIRREDSHYEQRAWKKSIFSVCLCKDSSDHKCIRDEKTTYCRGVSSVKLGEAQASGPQWLRRLWFRWLDPIICQQLRFDWSSVRSDNFRLILI